MKKGDALVMAEIAGIMASKRTSDLIPLCHQINLDYSKVKFDFDDQAFKVKVTCEV